MTGMLNKDIPTLGLLSGTEGRIVGTGRGYVKLKIGEVVHDLQREDVAMGPIEIAHIKSGGDKDLQVCAIEGGFAHVRRKKGGLL